MNFLKIFILPILLFYSLFVHANENFYIPKVIEINEVDLDVVRSLNETSKLIKPPLKTRGVGSQIFKNIAPVTAIIATENSVGSGFLVDNDGHVITNYHVVQKDFNVQNSFHSSVNLLFCTSGGSDLENQLIYQADVIKVDPTRDLALVKINSNLVFQSPTIDSKNESVEIGMDVHAIGHPDGGIPCTYTKGVVSQVKDGHEWAYSDISVHKAMVIQTQTPINPGNSGGPLINDNGLIVGINTFKHTEFAGINFAVSSSEIQDFITYGSKISTQEEQICDYEKIIKEVDVDQNGINELFHYDTDCNDVADTFGYDENEDGNIDIYLIDSNESGNPNVRLDFQSFDNGDLYARYFYDDNEDGEYEEVCYDTNLDQQIDECQPIS